MVPFVLQGAELSGPVTTYTAWRLQRVIEAYQAIPEQQQAATDDLLTDIGFLSLCQRTLSWRLQKDNFKLFVA